jgi:quinol-cytochrome oxidoreductase complex cytochrome b subunit
VEQPATNSCVHKASFFQLALYGKSTPVQPQVMIVGLFIVALLVFLAFAASRWGADTRDWQGWK